MGKRSLCAAIALMLALSGLCATSAAHDIYGDWKTRNGISCCHGRDCAPATAWQDMEGNWFTRRDGQTYSVPAHTVLPIPSPDGRSHACIIGGTVICFVPGEVRG